MGVPLAAEPFQAYGLSHWVVIVLLLVGLWPAVALGRRDEDGRIGRTLAVLIPCYTSPTQTYVFVSDRYDLEAVLPMQLCDLAWMAAAVALWTRHYVPVALTYYWGLALTSQAVLTPALRQDFPDMNYVAFWGQHVLIMWAAVYLTWGLRLRPSWAGYRATVVATTIWLVCVYGVNALLDTNYGYVNRKPPTASILDYLGPWPFYVGVEILIIAVGWALMTWPWTVRERAGATAVQPG